jgi:hypothetical protein
VHIDKTKSWITFVGEGRSGHTIVSAILGSHPNIKMGEEQKYIGKWLREGWTKPQIIAHLLESGVGRARRELNFPNIDTPKDPLLCIGDKCGWDAVLEVKKRGYQGDILADFGAFMGLPMKVIVTVRNPLDNISAWYQSDKMKRMYSEDELRCRRMIRRYKQFYDVAERVIKGHDTFFLHNEELIQDPAKITSELCAWLNIPCDSDWQNMCVSRVFKKPNQKRFLAAWPEGYKEERLDPWMLENSLMAYYR